ncbi:MAG: TolC family protein [Bacteroidota bacterium]
MNRYFIVLFFLLLVIGATAQDYRIGMIIDTEGNQERVTVLKEEITGEIQKILGASFQVVIDEKNVVPINWDAQVAIDAYGRLSPECDLVLLVGVLSAKSILTNGAITKPTIAIGITNVDIQEIPLTSKGTSGVKNFTYILTSRDIDSELSNFYELVEFKNLAILTYEKSTLIVNRQKVDQKLRELSEKFNAEINVIPVSDDIEGSLQNIPEGTDAVFIGSIYEFDDEQIAPIAQILLEKKLPSYALIKDYVEQGIMASVTADDGYGTLVRRLAIMVDEIKQGTPLENISVNLDNKNQLFFNVATSYEIGFSPSFETLYTANLLNAGAEEATSTVYGIQELLTKAFEVNLGIQITNKDVELAEQDVKFAVSEYLPTANVSMDITQVNESSTSEFIGQSERTVTQSGNVNQIIYDEEISANIGIQRFLNEAQKSATQQEINDVILDIYTAYFNILLTKTNVEIQLENLELLKKNLELSQLQRDIGSINSSDVFRWESEVAQTKQELIEAQTSLVVAKINLNTLLNNTLDEKFTIEDVSLDGGLYRFFEDNPVLGNINSPNDIQVISKFLVEEAKRNFPLRKELTYTIDATQRQLKGNKRAYYTPTVSLSALQSEVLDRSGAASTETSMSNFFDSNWSLGLSASYPLFDGNRRRYNIQTSKIQLEQLEMGLQDFDNNLELNISNLLTDLITTRSNIDFSFVSAESSWKNFLITQDFYRKGTVSVVQLFDSQNTALETRLAFNNSVYNYLLAFVTLENNVGFYSMLSTESQITALGDRYEQYKTELDDR